MTYNQFIRQVEQNNVAQVSISGNQIDGVFASPVTVGSNGATASNFTVYIPEMADTNVVEILQSNNVPIYIYI